MQRKLTRCGNNNFTISIPISFVRKNQLEPHMTLFLEDNGNSLTISTGEIKRKSDSREIFIDQEPEDAVFMMLSNLYNEGLSNIKITLKKASTVNLEAVEKYANNFHGISVERTDRSLILMDDCAKKKCPEVISKCFLNIILMTRHFNEEETKDHSWYREIHFGYERVFFLAEYISRLVHIEEFPDTKTALKYSAVAWSFECMAFLLKRIAEHEIEHDKDSKKFELDKLFSEVYNVCIKQSEIASFYSVKSEYEHHVMTAHYESVMRENLVLFSYLCTKLIKQYAIKPFPDDIEKNLRA